MSIIARAEQFVQAELAGNDASHDFAHIDRVRKLALSLAADEGIADVTDLEVIELSALLHDIADWKYSGSDTAGVDAARAFLTEHAYAPALVDQVAYVIAHLGFKTELGGPAPMLTPALAIVQDADRLDAIGAIGIARCFTFGGAKHRPLWDPQVAAVENISKQEYQKQRNTSSLNHFYEKLFLLKDKMKTAAGKRRAEQRHAFMVEFVERFKREWSGDA